MSDKSRIEWTDASWNPVTGCSKVSQGCKNCYAEREWPRFNGRQRIVVATPSDGIVPEDYIKPESVVGHWTRFRRFTDVQAHPERLEQPLHWKRPRRIFVNSMSDLFHENVSDGFISDVFNVMAKAKHHTFQLLTKRPERMRDFMNGTSGMGCGGLFMPNVWLGVSVEDQATANERIPILLDIATHVRWISAEPLLGPIDLTQILTSHGDTWNVLDKEEAQLAAMEHGCDGIINWVVAGGESGPKARPMHPEWVRSLRDQCDQHAVPFFFKQWGEWAPRSACYHTMPDGKSFADLDPGATKWPCTRLTESGGNGHRLEDSDGGDDAYMQRVGKALAGSLLEGIEHKAYPEVRP